MVDGLVRIDGLHHDFGGEPVLDIPELALGPGSIHLDGPNGAGKTTLLRVLATLLTPREGNLEILGHDPATDGRHLRARVGYAGHEPSLHDALTVHRNLTFHARLHGLEPDRADDAIATWGLTPLSQRPVHALSHGQRKRVDLARALVHEPAILLLDEPATGLDPGGLEQLGVAIEGAGPELVLVAAHGDPGIPTTGHLRLEAGRILEAPP